MDQTIIKISSEFHDFISNRDFPCVAAKNACEKDNIKIFVADHLACPKDDAVILSFIYSFTRSYLLKTNGFHSAAIIFKEPGEITEEQFDQYMWQRLSALRQMDRHLYKPDSRVSEDPSSPDFSFSLMEEAFFIIGLHPQNSRPARRFTYPALIFNPHAQFEEMKKSMRYEKMRSIVRKRDMAFSGSVNPMLKDFGEASEIYQYSGRQYSDPAQCPLHFNDNP